MTLGVDFLRLNAQKLFDWNEWMEIAFHAMIKAAIPAKLSAVIDTA